MDSTIATWTASRLAAGIAAKDLGSRELLDLYLDRVDRLNPGLNAVVTLDADRARAAADAADAATARGESRGPLHGLPITIKDAIEVEGVRSTGGAVELTEIATQNEAADNIVAAWRPKAPLEPGQSLAYGYRLRAMGDGQRRLEWEAHGALISNVAVLGGPRLKAAA